MYEKAQKVAITFRTFYSVFILKQVAELPSNSYESLAQSISQFLKFLLPYLHLELLILLCRPLGAPLMLWQLVNRLK